MIGEVLWGRPDENSPIDIHTVDVPIPDLPPDLNGLRMTVLADLHYGRYVWDQYAHRVVDLANAQQAEIILVIGDMVDNLACHAPRCAATLSKLRAPLGVWGCLGNHDYYVGRRTMVKALSTAGVRMLVNAHQRLDVGSAGLILAGVDDFRHGEPDPAAALADLDGAEPVILLSHNPDQAEHLPPAGRVDLMVSGHTHGGQVRLFGRALVTRSKYKQYCSSMAQGPRCPVYTSRGLAPAGLPIRVDCRAEIPIIRLCRPG